MKKLIILYIFTTIPNIIIASDNIPYISPGIRFGWNIGNSLFFGYKISIGTTSAGGIYNITYGARFLLNKIKKHDYDTFQFIELQAGTMSDNFGNKHVPLLSGGGIGTSFYKHEDTIKFYPRITAFTGFLVFITVDCNFLQSNNIVTDIGTEWVLPVPLKSIDFGSPGGNN